MMRTLQGHFLLSSALSHSIHAWWQPQLHHTENLSRLENLLWLFSVQQLPCIKAAQENFKSRFLGASSKTGIPLLSCQDFSVWAHGCLLKTQTGGTERYFYSAPALPGATRSINTTFSVCRTNKPACYINLDILRRTTHLCPT